MGYVAQSQDYIQSTDLAKRVRIWHETLGPKLELVEQRGGFDIHEYGTKVLSKFPRIFRKFTQNFCTIFMNVKTTALFDQFQFGAQRFMPNPYTFGQIGGLNVILRLSNIGSH